MKPSLYTKIKTYFSLEHFSAVCTWVIVTGISIFALYQSKNFSTLYMFGTFCLCALYLVVWLYISNENEQVKSKSRLVATMVLFFIVLAIYFVIPYNFVAIFMVIFSAITPYYLSIKRAFLLSPLWSMPLYLVYGFYWDQNGALFNAFLFWTFNIFALVMVNSVIKEKAARLEAEIANRQLRSTQTLLNEAVKQSERVRIARNIHDLLGHHLTALTIHLQVASRQSSGEVKASIDQCHHLSKLLLSDVREAVSDIRDKSQLDLKQSIANMIDKLPELNVELNYSDEVEISDIQVADAIIKTIQESITNTMKHAQGKQINVSIQCSQNQKNTLEVEIINDGKMPTAIARGNGLNGIAERIAALQGKVDFLLDSNKFYTQIQLPNLQHD